MKKKIHITRRYTLKVCLKTKKDEGEVNYSGFQIVEERNGARDCPIFILFKEDEARICKPWRKSIIIKLLGRKIKYKGLKPKLHKMWAKDGILDIIDLT